MTSTFFITGEYPETLIDPTLGNRLNTLRQALSLFLTISLDQIEILSIRSVSQYRNPDDLPLTFEQAKAQALTDVIFYIPSLTKIQITNKLNSYIQQFVSQFNLIVNAIEPDPCDNYICSIGSIPFHTLQ